MTGRERGWIPTTPEEIEACWAEARREARAEQTDRLRRRGRRRQAETDLLRHEIANRIVDLVAGYEIRTNKVGLWWLHTKLRLLSLAERLGF